MINNFNIDKIGLCITISRNWTNKLLREYFLVSKLNEECNGNISIVEDNAPFCEIGDRRKRICENMKKHLDNIKNMDVDYVIFQEDDSIPKNNNSHHLLLEQIKTNKYSIVTGAEVNRWVYRNYGLWNIKQENYETGDIEIMESVKQYRKDNQIVDACGWYFFIVKKEHLDLIPFEVCKTNSDIAPDVWWTYRLSNLLNKPILVDWRVKVKHYVNEKDFIITPCDILTYSKYRKIKWLSKKY